MDKEEVEPLTAPIFAFPKKKFVVVEIPAVVNNVEKALEMVGGVDSLKKVVFGDGKETKHLELKFDPSSHPIYSDTLRTNNILVKITKSGDKVSHEVLGIIDQTISFNGLSDFQYKMQPGQFSTEFLHPPVIFSRVDKEKEYFFKENPGSHLSKTKNQEGEDEETRTIKKPKRKVVAPDTRMVDDFELPKKPDIKAIDEPFDKILADMFEKRPIWTVRALKAHCHNSREVKLLKKLLPRHGYSLSKGPWRSAWVAWDIDPRESSSYSIYQIIDVRVPRQLKDKIQHKKGTNPVNPVRTENRKEGLLQSTEKEDEIPDDSADYYFDHIPTQLQNVYQLCDVPLKKIISIAGSPQDSFDYTAGWYSESQIKKMLSIVKEILTEWINQSVNQDDIETTSRVEYR